jgi:hypothetical protein
MKVHFPGKKIGVNMINKIKRSLLMGAMVLGVSFFTSNCALFDPAQNGPSCSITFNSLNYMCLDLIDTDAAAITALEDDCSTSDTYYSLFNGSATFDTLGCDLTSYDVTGYCEVEGTDYNYATWFSSDAYTSATAEAACDTLGGTWVTEYF